MRPATSFPVREFWVTTGFFSAFVFRQQVVEELDVVVYGPFRRAPWARESRYVVSARGEHRADHVVEVIELEVRVQRDPGRGLDPARYEVMANQSLVARRHAELAGAERRERDENIRVSKPKSSKNDRM